VLVLVFGTLFVCIQMMQLPPNFARIAMLILGLIFVLVLLGALTGTFSIPQFPVR
jgi:heme A synthase